MINANFIPPTRAHRARVRKLIRVWGIVLACYGGLLLIMLPAGRMAMALPTSADLDMRERAQQREAAAKSEIAKLAGTMSALADHIDAAETAGNHPNMALLLAALARARGDEAVYSRLALVVSQPAPLPSSGGQASSSESASRTPPTQRARQQLKVVLAGSAAGPSKVFELAQRLEGLGVFTQVTITQTRANTSAGEGATAFELEAIADELQETRP